MKRRCARASILVLLIALVIVALPTAALALISDVPDPLGTSSTNPGALGDAETWWRAGWGNSLWPDTALNAPQPDNPSHELVLGTLYFVDRSEGTIIDVTHPENYYRSARPDGTHLNLTLDMQGIYNYLAPADRVAAEPLVTVPIEGTWFYHFRFYSTDASTTIQGVKFGPTITRPIGIDVTKPRAVQGLQLRPAVGAPVMVPGEWVDSQRIRVSWTPGIYDDVAGVAYYEVLIDGIPVVPSVNGGEQGRVYEIGSGFFASSVTLEDPPAGHHTLSVVCVDRAVNQGPAASLEYNSDPDVPTIEILRRGGRVLGANGSVEASASDVGGVRDVAFALNGTTIATFSGPPYVYTFPAGTTTGTLSATVRDMRLRSVTTTAALDGTSGGGGTAGAVAPTFVSLNGTPLAVDAPLWTNLRVPEASFTSTGAVDRFAYTLDRLAGTVPDLPTAVGAPPTRLTAGASGAPVGLDLHAWLADQTVPWTAGPGVTDPIEGAWYLHARALQSAFSPPLSTDVAHRAFFVDVTAPRPITGLRTWPLAGPVWSDSAIRDISWDRLRGGLSEYDLLSGDSRFRVSIDGDASVVEFPVGASLSQAYFTTDRLAAGMHQIAVSAVDVAGNVGDPVMLALGVDYDAPVVSVVGQAGAYPWNFGPAGLVSAETTDDAGIRSVQFLVDGSSVGTATVGTPRWTVKADLRRFANGAHTLVARATDMAGHVSTASHTINIDKTVPTVAKVAIGPTPFYPIIREGYKDFSTVSFTLNKRATVSLYIYDGNSKLVQTLTAVRSVGRSSFKWNGRRADNTVSAGRYYYRLGAADTFGNSSLTAKFATRIMSYELVKTARNRVIVVPR